MLQPAVVTLKCHDVKHNTIILQRPSSVKPGTGMWINLQRQIESSGLWHMAPGGGLLADKYPLA